MPDTTLTPPPGLPEERAEAWVRRHQKRARWERRRFAFYATVQVLLLVVWGVSFALAIKASHDADALLAELARSTLPPTPQVLVAATPEKSPAVQQVRFIPEVPLEPELQEALWQACDQYAVPYELALAVAETESGFDLDADNGRCVGAMQINRVNFSWLEAEGLDPTTYEGNLRAGVLMLGQYLDTYEDWHKALMAYNCGAGGASKLWAQGYTSSKYSRAVVAAAENWKTIIEKGEF